MPLRAGWSPVAAEPVGRSSMKGSPCGYPVISNIRRTGPGPAMMPSRVFCAAERSVSSIVACSPLESMNPLRSSTRQSGTAFTTLEMAWCIGGTPTRSHSPRSRSRSCCLARAPGSSGLLDRSGSLNLGLQPNFASHVCIFSWEAPSAPKRTDQPPSFAVTGAAGLRPPDRDINSSDSAVGQSSPVVTCNTVSQSAQILLGSLTDILRSRQVRRLSLLPARDLSRGKGEKEAGCPLRQNPSALFSLGCSSLSLPLWIVHGRDGDVPI